MSFKKGDIVTVSNVYEEYLGTALVLYMNDKQVDIKIIGEQAGFKEIPEGKVLLGYENNNSVYAAYCEYLKKCQDTGVIQLQIIDAISVINRRFSTRYPAFYKVGISPLEFKETFEGIIRNMSLRGVMLNTHADLEVNDFVVLDIEHEDGKVRIKARIARKNGQDGKYIYGLNAVDLDYDQKVVMRSIITELKEKNRKSSERIIKEYIGN
mgnify:CR=1 FL=1